MGGSQSQESQEKSDDAIMRQIARNEGHAGVIRYIDNNIDRWKKEPVEFGIIGRTATGKSSFVNLVRNVKKGDEGYARVGRGNTTLLPTPYFHPDNRQIVFWDLPGVATIHFRKHNYIHQMRLKKYDYFFVFFDSVLHEDDLWVAEQLIRMDKPFCLVRSKVDEDVKKGIEQGIDEKTIILNLRTETLQSINKDVNLKAHCKVFFISCETRGVGEIDILFQHIRENLSSIKSESVVYSLHILSENVIDEKYKSLKSRVQKASLATALIAASPIPGIDIYANISILVKEIKHYIKVFGLTSKQIKKLSYADKKQLKCREFFRLKSEKRTRKMVTTMFIRKYFVLFTALSISDIFLPIVGSAVSAGSTATIVYKFLNEILENLHQDAIFVYDRILPLPVRVIRTLREQFEKEGQEGINKFIFDVLNRWKEEPVILGVIGESDSGKIEFINLIRRLKINNSGFAKEKNTTTPFYHQNNEGVVFIGTGLSDSKEMQISCYDDFFLFLNNDIYADDMWILHELTKIDKSFSVIRTKSTPRQQDQEKILGTGLAWLRLKPDLELVEKIVGRDEEIDSDRLRDIICSHLYKDNEDEYDTNPNVCVLSCLDIGLGEIDKLIIHMIQNLPPAKSEAVLNALHPSSPLVIEEKCQSLKKRIVFVTTVATSTTAFHIPSFCFPVNMHILVDEITHYIKVFGFSDKDERPCVVTEAEVNKLRCRELLESGVVFSDIINRQLKALSTDDNIAGIEIITDLFVPVAGSVVSSANNAAIVYKCLTGFLEDFRHDAFVVNDRILAEHKSS